MIKGYAVIHAGKVDNGWAFIGESDIREVFTSKRKAKAAAHRLNDWERGVNGLRKAEGSRERMTGVFIVVSFSIKSFDDIPHGLINVKEWGEEV